jgi:hypothetical protein
MPVLTLDPADTTSYEPGVYQGIIGGIPTRTTVRNVLDYGAVEGIGGSVATNNAAFTAARAACGQNEKVYFPAGIWNINSVGFAWTLSNRTICGAGMFDTTLRIFGGDGATFGVDPVFSSNFCVVATVTAGFTKGTSTFTVSPPVTPNNGNSANFTVGKLIVINIPLSNFVLPDFYRTGTIPEKSRYSLDGKVSRAFTLRPGGYRQVLVPGVGWRREMARKES